MYTRMFNGFQIFMFIASSFCKYIGDFNSFEVLITAIQNKKKKVKVCGTDKCFPELYIHLGTLAIQYGNQN